MRLLLVTNLYPPQELGGYGRCMADFCWGLQQRGHQLQVLSSDAPYLGASGPGPSGEAVVRGLQLKGSFADGVRHETNPQRCAQIDLHNVQLITHMLASQPWDGILLGNIDLLGPGLLPALLATGLPVLHHIGFVHPPYDPAVQPLHPNYHLVSASRAVASALQAAGFQGALRSSVVYPGVRLSLFGQPPLRLPGLGTPARPLRVGFAGLLMSSKGAHTLVESLVELRSRGLVVQVMLAGARFQAGYYEALLNLAARGGCADAVQWVGPLGRAQLVRFLTLQHAVVFASIYPEAFGIVAAEAMASGAVLLSTGVGGAAELFEHGGSGLGFSANQSSSLSEALERLCREPDLQQRLALAGRERVCKQFSVEAAAAQLEQLFACYRAGGAA